MNPLAAGAIMVAAAYLIGGIPFGYVVGRWRGLDVREKGSGNIGATNVARLLGLRFGLLVFALDVSKGLVPVLVAGRVLRTLPDATAPDSAWWFYTTWLLVAVACILGHVFPIYLRLRGGKGVATALGVVLGIWPMFTLPGLAAFGVFVVVALTTRYISLASMTASVSFSVAYFVMRQYADWPAESNRYLLPFAILLPILVLLRHRTNIRRLLAGQEPRFGTKA